MHLRRLHSPAPSLGPPPTLPLWRRQWRGGRGEIIHGADRDVATETTTTTTTTTASSSTAVPALSDKRDDGGIVVHPSLVHALGSRRVTTTTAAAVAAAPLPRPRPPTTRDPPRRRRRCHCHRQPDDARPPPGKGVLRRFCPCRAVDDEDAPRIPTTIHRDRAHCRRRRRALRCLSGGIPMVRPPAPRQ
jgi:hypothetical protein